MPTIVWITIGLILLIALATAGYSLWRDSTQSLHAGALVILAITLVVLIVYAWDTRRIANATEQKWEEERKPKIMYEMVLAQQNVRDEKVMFRLINPSNYFVKARVNLNFEVYGDPVGYHPVYDGKEIWLVYPGQMCQGWYSIGTLLGMKGKTSEQMLQERTESNKTQQLTCDLQIDFTSETGYSREYPSRHHYFDFDRWAWIPDLTVRE